MRTKTYRCVRCGGVLTYEDQVNPHEPGEYLHLPGVEGVDENDLARCADGERGYPAPSSVLGNVFWHNKGVERTVDLSELPEGHYIVNTEASFWQGPFKMVDMALEYWMDRYPGERLVHVGRKQD